VEVIKRPQVKHLSLERVLKNVRTEALLLGEEAVASPSIGKTLWAIVALFNDVHAFGYNSAGSERIWMKFEAFRVYCL